MDTVQVYINNISYKFDLTFYSIIQVCELLNISIPRFCFHESLSISGNCRICVVELKHNYKPVISCGTTISNNMVLYTNSLFVFNTREIILEFLLLNHPLDCPICDQGGECDLQDQTLVYGRDRSRFLELKRSILDTNWGIFIKTIMTRCIHCTRCVRYFSEIIGLPLIGTIGRGVNTEIASYTDLFIESEILGNVVDLCPVGALTSKPYSFTYRVWELVSFESIDLLDTFFSYIRIDLRNNDIIRIVPLLKNTFSSDNWITDKIRFSYDAFKVQRLLNPYIKTIDTSLLIDCSWENAYEYITINLFYSKAKWLYNIYFFTGSFIDIGSLLLFKYFTYSLGILNLNINIYYDIDFRNQFLISSDLYSIQYNNVFILYGLNTKIENSILNIKLRQLSLYSDSNLFFYIGNHIKVNYNIIHIGFSILSIIDIYYGKHYICYFVHTSEVVNFLTGKDSFFEDLSCLFITLKLNFWLKKNILFHFNNLFTGDINVFEYNITSMHETKLIDIYMFVPKFIYLLGVDLYTSFFNNNNFFVLYQGHHVDTGALIANVILPSTIYIETKGFYLNCEGSMHFIANILDIPCNVLFDDYIIYSLWKYIYLNSSLIILNENSNSYNSNYFLNTFFNFYDVYLKYKIFYSLNYVIHLPFFLSIIKFNIFRKLFIEDSFFITTSRNFFTMDIFCKNSSLINSYLNSIHPHVCNIL